MVLNLYTPKELYLYQKMLNNKVNKINGFTLLEMLIVLGVWSVLLLLVTPLVYTGVQQQQEETFLETFEFDLLYMQRLSTLTKDYVRFGLREDKYVILQGISDKPILERDIPPGWNINLRSLKAISFDQNGRVRKPITIFITTNHSKYNVIFPLGKGRAYVVKE